MELPLNQILLGDCLELLRKLPDDCIDSVVTDPPYGLGNKDPDPMDILAFMQGSSNSLGPLKKGRKHCLNNVIDSPIVSDPDATDPHPPENRVTFSVTCASLPMKVGPIEFDRQASTGKHEVDDEGLVRQLHDILVDEVDSLIREGSGHGQLCLRKRESFSGCVETCSCFSEPGNSRVRVLVWLGDDSFGQTRTAASIVATGTAELRAMLTLDLLRRTGELSLASATDECDAGLLLATTEDVGTPGGAGRLPTAIKALLSCEVTPTADEALTFDVSVPRALLTRIHDPRVHQTDFMNRSWQLPSVEVWREVYRVLKPGGYVASFAGTRTFDLMSIGLRMAGFECRDTISRFHPEVELPILQWIQSQGMPKSHAIGKAIDKKLGKTREVVGTTRGRGGENLNRLARPGKDDAEDAKGMGAYGVGAKQVDVEVPVTLPASKEASQWEGWGSALKPCWEPILLFRKPFKASLAENVLEHGTGGLNIDATRVRHSSQADFEAHKAQVDAIKQKGGSRGKSWKNSSDLSGANEVKEGGRWPSNLVIEHSARCQREGTKRVKAITGGTAPPVRQREVYDAAGGYNKQGAEQPAVKAYGDADGLEEVEAWRCADGCPVLELNEQSGERPSTLTGRADPATSHRHPGTEMNANSAFLGERTHLSRVYADGGGAARFFTQFEGEDWECVEGCPVKALDDQSGITRSGGDVKGTEPSAQTKAVCGDASERSPHDSYADEGGASRFFSQFDGVPFKYVPKANRREAGCGEFEVQHITLKPVSLIRWLVKLVTRKGGIVLDMYAGSGTTPHAAVLEGMQFIGIERDPVNHAEAERRLNIVLEREEERRYDQDLFEFAHGGEQGLL